MTRHKPRRPMMSAPSLPAEVPWTPFREMDYPPEHRAMLEAAKGFVGVFRNSRYQVEIYEMDTPIGRVTWLAIVRLDRSPVHDWRDFQRIKNELLGPEREAAELYPAESRLVDTNNQFHLFAIEPGAKFPFGYMERDVSDTLDPGSAHAQRPFETPPPGLNERRGLQRINIVGTPVDPGSGSRYLDNDE